MRAQASGAVLGRRGGEDGAGEGEAGGEVYSGEMEVVAGRGNCEVGQLEQELRQWGRTCGGEGRQAMVGRRRHSETCAHFTGVDLDQSMVGMV